MPAKPTPSRPLYTVACKCGARATLDARQFGRPIVCRKCGGASTVAWKKDPVSRRNVPVVVTQARSRGGVRPGEPMLIVRCLCGYSRPARPVDAANNPRCPGCGRSMIVEKPPAAGSTTPSPSFAPAPSPTAHLPMSERPPVRVELPPGSTAFNCPCGERLLVRSGSFGREVQCPACDRRLVLDAFRDPQTMVTKIRPRETPPSGTPLAPVHRIEKNPTPSPVTRSPVPNEAVCACGHVLGLMFTEGDFTCASCGRTGRLERSRHPQTLVTMLKPVFPGQATPSTGPRVASLASPTPSPAASDLGEVVFEELDAEGQPLAPAAPPATDMQEVLCECGDGLFVTSSDEGHPIQCPTCSALVALERVGTSGGAPVFRVKVLGKLGDEDWSLADFS